MTPARRRDPVHVGAPRREQRDGFSRVVASVDGEEAWFETRDLDLVPVAEAWATAFLIPALERRTPLTIEAAVDPVWLRNSANVLQLLNRWWHYPISEPVIEGPQPDSTRGGQAGDMPTLEPGGETALFFSCGTDSFYTLNCSGEAVDHLVLLQGFDFDLEARARHAAVERSVRDVAAARGLHAVIVRTNVRAHPLFRGVSWERAHGGVLASVGHLLGDAVREVLISSSISLKSGRPWGSHYSLDPLWGSSRRAFRSVGQERRKGEKLRVVAGDPLVRAHLRVCWQSEAGDGNCSRCSKCLYARLVLADCGVLEQCGTFDGAATLVRDLDAMPKLKGHQGGFAELLDGCRPGEAPHDPPHGSRLDPEARRALHDLLARTRRLESFPVRWRRAALGRVMEWIRPGRD